MFELTLLRKTGNMKKYILVKLLILNAFLSFGQKNLLVWSDEFDLDTVNAANWNFDIGNGTNGWGNNESQYYTNRPQNVKIDSGILVITALKESYNGYQYTSARLHTKNKAYWKYGRIEMRAKLPKGRGTWPAFWMLPQQQIYGSNYWPDNGEIDIMEYVGYEPSVVHGTVHTHENYGGSSISRTITYYGVENDFHVYAIEWTPEIIRFYVDSYYYGSYQKLGHAWNYWPFDQNFFLLLNFAIGGNWGGAQGIDNTIFPQTYKIDYVRVYDMNLNNIHGSNSNTDEIYVSPNPSQGNFKLYINNPNQNDYQVSIFDAIGNQVIPPVKCKSGESGFEINNLKPGIYFLRIQNKEVSKTIKIVKN